MTIIIIIMKVISTEYYKINEKNLLLEQKMRIFRGMSRQEVAQITGLTQSSISQAEKKRSKPQSKTCERLAAVYQCEPSQLIL